MNNAIRLGLLALTWGVTSISLAQQTYSYQLHHIPVSKGATINVSAIQEDFNPMLQHLEMPSPSGNNIRMQLREKKKGLSREMNRRLGKNDTIVPVGDGKDPKLGKSMDANQYNNRVPNDNDLAISNGGLVVSVTNSIIYMYDINQSQLLKTISLNSFADTLGLTESKYDPKTVYDPIEDRFIVVCLNGNLDSTSRIILAFSQSNDPTGDWNLYALDGNPIDNDTWSDYPSLGLSEEELFLSFNTFENGSVNNSGFIESTFWQIDKSDGYAGNTLDTRYFSGLEHGGLSFFNITPIQGGIELYGPEMYMLSNRNLATTSDTLYLLKMDNTIANNGQLSVTLLKTPLAYWLPPPARQGNGNYFDTNDSRILGGFLHEGTIQYVANTGVPSTGFAGIYHGFIEDVDNNPTVSANIIGDTSLDFGYPNISYTGQIQGDQDAIITFNHVSPTVTSGFSAVYYDEDGYYSDIVQLRNGFTWVDVLNDTVERWGDYSGSQPRYNERGKVWAVGSYGRGFVNASWMAEIARPDIIGKNPNPTSEPMALAYPNPFQEMLYIDFELQEPVDYRMMLYNQGGRLVKLLLTGQAKAGSNSFSFSTDPLPRGIYFLRLDTSAGQPVFSRKVIKQ